MLIIVICLSRSIPDPLQHSPHIPGAASLYPGAGYWAEAEEGEYRGVETGRAAVSKHLVVV